MLIPNAIKKAQGYIAKNGSGVHGSLLLRTIFKILFELEVFPPVVFYWNDKNYSNEFIKVFNELPPDVIEPDWMLVRQCAFSNAQERDDGTYEPIKKEDSTTERAVIGINGGIASQVASKRGNTKFENGKLNHHSKPPRKECTKHMSRLFAPASSLMKSSEGRGDWLDEGVEYYVLPDHPDYVEEFAEQNAVGEDNIVPSLRPSAWNEKNLMQGHFDSTNGKRVETEAIAALNRCEEDFQIRLNWSAKESQENYVVRQKQDEVIKYVAEEYKRFDPVRRYISSDLARGGKEDFIEGNFLIPKPCHMRTDSFYAIYLFYAMALFSHFSLTMPEMVSIMMCIMNVPNSGVFFAIAAKTLMHFYTRETLNVHGFDIGFVLERIQKELYWKFLDTPPRHRSTHWQRFSDQRSGPTKFKKMKRKVWHRKCKMMLKIFLRLWNHFADAPPSAQLLPTYYASLTKISKVVHGAGVLTATHAFRISAHVSLVPSWIAKAAKLEKGAKPALWLYHIFPDHADDISREPNTFLASLTFYLQQDNPDEHINLGTCENILCKVCFQ